MVTVHVVLWLRCCSYGSCGAIVMVHVIAVVAVHVVLWLRFMWCCGYGECGAVVMVNVVLWLR